jgi:peptidoglycan/xylan/chitin deacetylase (PgdA/CDA1 family)
MSSGAPSVAGVDPAPASIAPIPPGGVAILMYHSISDTPGPTSIAAATFRMQMEELVASGAPVLPLERLLDAAPLPPRAVVITFDDGLVDFADAAWPILRDLGLPVINFLPMGRLGGHDDWGSSRAPVARPILTPDRVQALSLEGADFGAHSLSHPDLTTLSAAECVREVRDSGDALERLLGRPCLAFAAPYGATNAAVRREIAARYRVAVGTHLARAHQGDDPHDLPRIEMFYFGDRSRWREFLAHRGAWYLRQRQALRSARRVAVTVMRRFGLVAARGSADKGDPTRNR